MAFLPNQFISAKEDFRRARQKAALQEIVARLTGKSTALLSYEEVARKLRAAGQASRGLKEIPLDAIVGSVGRYVDFTRDFLPRQDSDEQRWAGVKMAATDPDRSGLPPIDVYQIGGAYFVLDGNHRVSVARQIGATTIDAYVTEIRTRVPLTPDVQPDDLIIKAEYVEFLEKSQLDQSRPAADFTLTAPGQYSQLEQEIEIHRQLLSSELGREAAFAEAASHWYDEGYVPILQMIRDKGMLRDFPGRTEADLYLWILRYRSELEEELGWQLRPEAVASDLAAHFASRPQSAASRLLNTILPDTLASGPTPGEWRKDKLADRYIDRLFADVLVPLSGEEASWCALEQALVLARREESRLHGLHVLSTQEEAESETALAVQARFNQLCSEVGVSGSLAIEVGEVARKICERSALTDLVVLNLAYPPSSQWLARLGSGFRTIIRQCARPVLAVPGQASPLESALLAYDGSLKSKEALFVATYMAEIWKIPLTVLTVAEADNTTPETQNHAKAYLELHEVQATFINVEAGSVPEAILKTAGERESDLIIMGGYRAHPVVEVMLGSSVDRILRESKRPMLICQ
jgi:nucleotide-binding universal stress UspA family protein